MASIPEEQFRSPSFTGADNSNEVPLNPLQMQWQQQMFGFSPSTYGEYSSAAPQIPGRNFPEVSAIPNQASQAGEPNFILATAPTPDQSNHRHPSVNPPDQRNEAHPAIAPEPEHAPDSSNSFLGSLVAMSFNPIGARIGYQGLTGQLLPSDKSVQSMMSRGGEFGDQLLGRWGSLERQGWRVGSLNADDIASTGLSFDDLNKTVGFSSSDGHILGYLPWRNTKSGVFNIGSTNPLKRSTNTMAHELAHVDGIPFPDDISTLGPEEQKIVASRTLETETNAILSQLRLDQQIGNKSTETTIEEYRLQKGQLGSYIKRTWGKQGGRYSTLDSLSDDEANQIVTEHLNKVYGPDIVGPGGKVNDYKLDDVYGKYSGHLDTDEASIAELWKPGTEEMSAAAEATGIYSRLGQGVAGLGTALLITGVGKDFLESPKKGVGDLGRVGFDYGAYEVGTRTGNMLGALGEMAIGGTELGRLAVPLGTAAGFGVSVLGDYKFGKKIQNAIESVL